MSQIEFKKLAAPFPENEIEWRIGRAGKNQNGAPWATALAYVSARAIQERLDEVVGPSRWTVSYAFVGGDDTKAGVICKLGIEVSPGAWVFKEDGSEQTDIESFKGGLSGALKRAGVLWGIGRYLYGLTEDYVKIVDKSAIGARYGVHKPKQGDPITFYWVAPLLPVWALPENPPITNAIIKPWTKDQMKEFSIAKWNVADGNDLSVDQKTHLAALSKTKPFRVAMNDLQEDVR